jgi:hypothetical protein
MQETIGWLSGNSQKYDRANWKTNYYSTGTFEKLAFHKKDSELWLFDQESFSGFVPNVDGNYQENIFYFSRRGRITVPSSLILQMLSSFMRDGVDFENFHSQSNRAIVEKLRTSSDFRALIQEKVPHTLATQVDQIPVIKLYHFPLTPYFADLVPPEQQELLLHTDSETSTETDIE